MMRVVEKRNALSYEVAERQSDPSLQPLRLRRAQSKADIFYNIAPSYRTADEIVEGVEYIVRSHTGGAIIYNGATMPHLTRFYGVKGVKKYEITGDALALEYEGIRPDAPKNGWSNEWLMSVETRPHHPSSTSLFGDETFGWYLRHQRCLFYSYLKNRRLAVTSTCQRIRP
jgi:hypothetical protein